MGGEVRWGGQSEGVWCKKRGRGRGRGGNAVRQKKIEDERLRNPDLLYICIEGSSIFLGRRNQERLAHPFNLLVFMLSVDFEEFAGFTEIRKVAEELWRGIDFNLTRSYEHMPLLSHVSKTYEHQNTE